MKINKNILLDIVLLPFIALAVFPLRLVRRGPVTRIPITRWILNRSGVFPITSHYYEPLFDTTGLRDDRSPRELPGINFGIEQQRALLAMFKGNVDVIRNIPNTACDETSFYLENGNFSAGDAEIWFHVIRHFKPKRIVEIGSGHSTRMAQTAIRSESVENPGYKCDHICIEPYEMPWLEKTGVRVLRKKLEDTDISIIESLRKDDILFIDSSHMIRPKGEVLQEFLQILPKLNSGVIVHIHDIFSPRDYPLTWLEHPHFWNEQYLLEAFLTQNSSWEVLLGVNMLKHDAYEELSAVCPNITKTREPGSFYIRRH